MAIHDKKHLKEEGVYFASQRSIWMLDALQSQQGIREMLVLCSFSFASVQAPSAFRRVFLPQSLLKTPSLTWLEVYFLGDAESCQVDNGDEPSFTVKMKILSLSLREGILCSGRGWRLGLKSSFEVKRKGRGK